MDQMLPVELAPPKYIDAPAMRVAGLSGEYTRATTDQIPKQWEKFNAQLFAAGLADDWTLGVVYPTALMRYITGVEIAADAPVPEGWIVVTVPAQRYAIFAETGGIPAIRRAFAAIFTEWLPRSGMKPSDGPMIERYPEDWMTSGNFEIWIPLQE
jgi:AraC family transcriptional regulator